MVSWIEIKDSPGYEISSDGQVRNAKTRKTLKPHLNRIGGYERVDIGGRHKYIHRMIAENFFACGVKDGDKVIHRDGDRSNNHANNLKIVKKIPHK